MRVLVTGGRSYADQAKVFEVLDSLHDERAISVIIQGECPYGGADLFAKEWAAHREIPCVGFYGRRDKQTGRFLGPERNQRMIDEGKPDLVVAFPGGDGTANCVRLAMAAGVRVVQATPAPGE